MMRPPAPSLDVIAGQRQATAAPNDADEHNVTMAEADYRDSRSSSSTNSPVPADNEESDFYPLPNDSESSLGVVPNLQEMQVNDECLPIAVTLPSEILISIFSRLSAPSDMYHCMLVSKRWARNIVEMLWHRPTCTSWEKHTKICQTLGLEAPMFAYTEFIKRLNLSMLGSSVSDGSVLPLAVCTRVERLTLTNCGDLTDAGLIPILRNSQHLLALDISHDAKITELSMIAIAENCRKLQGLNVSKCRMITNDSMIQLAESCKFIKRLKLNECEQLQDDAVIAFARNCPNILEIDLHGCKLIGNEPVTALLAEGQSLRELRLANCDLIDDGAFLSLPANKVYEHLRILDLTCCARLTDRAVEKIVDVAPRLRNLVLAKCGNITDNAVYAISRLGKNLHYVHLGHCRHITDDAVKRLVQCCNRIRYIDLGCCAHLTDDSVMKLATLPKLKRIGLVKCSLITDESMFALARANYRSRPRRDHGGQQVDQFHASSLERVHLSYCVNLTLRSIIKLLNSCHKLTHLSLTGVPAFLRDDLEHFCREAPRDFTEQQRALFCVFSGPGVTGLRKYFNTRDEFAEYHEPGLRRRLNLPGAGEGVGAGAGANAVPAAPIPDVDGFEEADGVEDDDMGEGSEIALDNEVNNNVAIPPPPPPLGFIPTTHTVSVAGIWQAAGAHPNGDNSMEMNHDAQIGALDNFTTPLLSAGQASLEESIAIPHRTMNQPGSSTAGTAVAGFNVVPNNGNAGPSMAPMQAQLDDDGQVG